MRVMAIIMATSESPPGEPLDQAGFVEVVRFNEQLVQAGVLLAGERLQPRSSAVWVQIPNGRHSTVPEPRTGSHPGIAGFWLWQVRSMDEAIEWARRSPRPATGTTEIEIRPVMESAALQTGRSQSQP